MVRMLASSIFVANQLFSPAVEAVPQIGSAFNVLQSAHEYLLSRKLVPSHRLAEACTDEPFLWKIHNNSTGEHVGFGIGTVHLPSELVTSDDAWVSMSNALADSCEVYGELNLLDPQIMQAVQTCTAEALHDAPRTSDIPDEELRDRVMLAIADIAFALSPDASEAIEASLLSVPLYTVQQIIQGSNTPAYRPMFFDSLLTGKQASFLDSDILELGRPAGGLEEVETQCNALALLNPSRGDFLEKYEEEMWAGKIESSLNASMTGLISAYRCGGGEVLDEGLDDGTRAGMMLQDVIIDSRNVQMANRMVELMSTAKFRPLFAVGLGHWIVGEKTLEIILQKEGYSIERVGQYGDNELEDLSNDTCNEKDQVSAAVGTVLTAGPSAWPTSTVGPSAQPTARDQVSAAGGTFSKVGPSAQPTAAGPTSRPTAPPSSASFANPSLFHFIGAVLLALAPVFT